MTGHGLLKNQDYYTAIQVWNRGSDLRINHGFRGNRRRHPELQGPPEF